MSRKAEKIERLLDDLIERAKDYDGLSGVELTTEDAYRVLELIKEGEAKEYAIDHVLDDIVDTISSGWED